MLKILENMKEKCIDNIKLEEDFLKKNLRIKIVVNYFYY